MTIWIDPPAWPAHGRLWSHLISDRSLEELHEFAAALGIPARGFEGDHYDVPEDWFQLATAHGARLTDSKDLLARLTEAGLRLRKRRGDRGIAIVRGVVFADGAIADIDLIQSPVEAPEAKVFCSSNFVRDARGDFLVVHSRRRQEWGPPGGWRERGESPRQTAVRETAEESGLVLDPDSVRAIGYERFHIRLKGSLPLPIGDLMQVYQTTLPKVRPSLAHVDPGITALDWVPPAEFERRCRGLFWWPLASHLFEEFAGELS